MTTPKKILPCIFILLCINRGHATQPDSSNKKLPLFYEASVKAGYHYGFIQGYTFDQSFPDQLFLTEGNMGLRLFKLPFQVEYRYATMQIPYGLNNYFRIKFDASQYLRDLEMKKQGLNKLNTMNLDSVYLKRQELMKKLLYRRYQVSEMLRLKKDSLQLAVPDSLTDKLPPIPRNGLPDSLRFDFPQKPGMPQNPIVDSLQELTKDYNSLLGAVQKTQAVADSLEKLKQLQDFNTPQDSTALYKKELQKRKQKIFRLNSFELGTCFPNNSYLMYGTLPVNGVFTDFEYQGVYVSFLYGEVMNNFLFANTFFERQLLSTKNVTNFFDFSRTNRGRKVTAFKIGKGRFQDNHVHVGFLYGLGMKNYGDTALISDIDLQPKQSNAVLELSSRYKIKKHQFEFALAKSVLGDHRAGGLMNGLLDFDKTYSLAGVVIYSTSFFKEKTRLKVLVRHLQPYYQSFGLGFMNSDYLRVNVKVDQRIGKKLTVGGFVKNDVDNLYNLVSLTNNIFNYGVNTGLRIGRSWNIRLTYNPIVQKITDNQSGLVTRLNNCLYNANVSFTKRRKKTTWQSNVNYNYFALNDFNGKENTFQNITASHSVNFGRTTISLTSTYFSTNIIDSLDPNNFMNGLTVSFNVKKVSLRLGAKHFSNLAGTQDYGALLGIVIPLNKYFALSLEGQKFVMGDYFLTNNALPLNKVPYYFGASVLVRL